MFKQSSFLTVFAGVLGMLVHAPSSALTLGKVELSACDLKSASGTPIPAQCASLEAPLDHAGSKAETISLKLAVIPARSSESSSDAVVLLAGGPGQSALDSYGGLAAALGRLNEKRSIILLDQRGTGLSTPLECESENGLENVDPSDTQALQAELKRCLAKLKTDPRFFSTTDAIADLEWLRAKLALPAWNLYAVSYGTRVAQRYLKTHPKAVRSVILDGVVPVDLRLGESFGSTLNQALNKIGSACQDQGACQSGELVSQIRALVQQVQAAPAEVRYMHPDSGLFQSVRIDEPRIVGLVRLLAYAPETYALLPFTLKQAQAGTLEPLMAQSALVSKQLADSIGFGAQLSVVCTEDRPEPNRLSDEERQSLMGDRFASQMRAMCDVWPAGMAPDDFFEGFSSDVPALLLSGEFDPVTPPEFAERSLKHFSNGRHLIARGQGHNVLPRGCISRLAASFVEELKPAELEVECLETMRAAPFFISPNGTQP